MAPEMEENPLSSSCSRKRFPGGGWTLDPPATSLTRAGWSGAVFGTHKGGAANYGRPQGALSDGGTDRLSIVSELYPPTLCPASSSEEIGWRLGRSSFG